MSIKDLLLGILITFIWGINFSVIKIGLTSLDPFILAGLRFLLCAVPFIFFVKKPNVQTKYLVYYGLSFGIGLWGFAYLAMYFGVSAGVSSLLVQMGIFFTIILGYFALDEDIDIYKKIGGAVAISGLILILYVTDGSITIIGLILALVAAFFMGVSNIVVKKSKTKEVLSFIIWSSLFAPIPLFILAFITQGSVVYVNFFDNLDRNAIFSILFQVYPTTLFGYWVWNSLINKYPVSSVAPLGLLVPIFGLFGSYIIFDENIGNIKLIACLLIITGLAINTYGARIKNIKIK
jgi:O-acetylserine/cysteine efflux transporter